MDNNEPIHSTPLETTGEVAALALNAVPIIGGVISDIANFYIKGRQNKRLNKFLMDLVNDLRKIQNRINEDRINSEEYKNVFEDILEKVSRCSQQNKLDAFRALFVNITFTDTPKYDEALEVSGLIDKWQDRHIVLLKILDNPHELNLNSGNRLQENSGSFGFGSINQSLRTLLPEWDEEQIARTWKDLYDSGIHNWAGTLKTMMSDSGVRILENKLTSFGKRVVAYIKNPTV